MGLFKFLCCCFRRICSDKEESPRDDSPPTPVNSDLVDALRQRGMFSNASDSSSDEGAPNIAGELARKSSLVSVALSDG